jgi:hypothetical protein
VKKVHEYLEHAAECREMARTASPAHRQQLEQMAETWEQLAEARRRQREKEMTAAKSHTNRLAGEADAFRILRPKSF